MRSIALPICILGSAMSIGCTDTTVEDVGSFSLNGQNYVIKSSTPGNATEATAREQATYSVKVKGGTVTCDGSTSDCKAAAQRKIQELESDEGAYG